MKKIIKFINSRFSSNQAGQALIIVLVLLVLGSLTIIPVLDHIGTALKTGEIYEAKTEEYYAADAGVDDAIWRIKYDFMGLDYDLYDFDTTWSYETETINGMVANITIQNIWIPTEPQLDPAEARDIIQSEKLVVVGTAGAIPGEPYSIKIDFTPAEGDNLTVKSLGVWLPQGFHYDPASCSLQSGGPSPDYEDVTTCEGGEAVVWSYVEPYPLFIDFPGVDPEATPMSLEFTFEYDPPAEFPNRLPTAIAWITTDMNIGSLGYPNENDVPISWDMDTRIYKITSDAGGTKIQAYTSKCELRHLGDAMSGDYVATGNSLMIDPVNHIYTHWLSESSTTVSSIPDNADVLKAYLYWSGFQYDNVVFSDTCSSTNFNSLWTNGGDWEYYDSYDDYYRGRHSGEDSRRYLTMSNSIDLSSYPGGTQYEITWDQSITPNTVFSDSCNDLDNWDYGSAWNENNNIFRARSSTGPDDPARLLVLKDGTVDLSPYVGKTVTISCEVDEDDYHLGNDEGLDYAFSSDNGSNWSDYDEVFRDDISGTLEWSEAIPGAYLTNGFKVRFKLVGFTGSAYCYIDDIRINVEPSSSDGLDFALSADGGGLWSDNIQAFRGNIGTSWTAFSYNLPDEYATDDFKMRFQLAGIDEGQSYCNIDDIKITVRAPDTSVDFTIGEDQVYLNESGNPVAGDEPLTASSASILVNEAWGGYSFACHRDVSKLVKKYPIVPGEEHHTGNAEYTVGDVQADPGEHVSYAGWSLIIIYASPEMAGHYLYLYDVFSFNPQYTNLDFDGDGDDGGDITNFVIPEPITDQYGQVIEEVAAKLTCFVGEGDDWLYGTVPNTDCVRITGQQAEQSKYLSNSISPNYNVWNSASPELSYDGVDIDTFEVLWEENILTPGDDRLSLDFFSGQDAWNLVYMILSVRSETVTGGTTHYIIGSN